MQGTWLASGWVAAVVVAVGMGGSVARGEPKGEVEKLLSKLHEVHTAHYDIETDLEPALVKELSSRMDSMYDEYGKRLPGYQQPAGSPPLPAILLTKESDYDAITDAEHTAGVFVQSEHPFLAAHLGEGRDELRRTLQHEAFHQFAYFAIGHDLPVWLNEGLAQVFEEGVWTGKDFWMAQVRPARLRNIQADIKSHRLVPFKKFIAITHEEWAKQLGSKDEMDATYYNQAWAMGHFLMESGQQGYREKLMAFLKSVHGGDGSTGAFEKIFSVPTFQADFSRWVLQLRPTVGATMVERQEVLGQFVEVLGKDGKRFEDVKSLHDYVVGHGVYLQYAAGRVKWETSHNPEEYFCDAYGRRFGTADLFFQKMKGSKYPDIVCRASQADIFRTHFYENEGKDELEVLIDTVRR